jgi:SAM-dependent methyltransferase
MSNDEFLETAYRESAESRQKIYDHILESFLRKEYVALDYGCGPGFLAKIVAENVEKVYACDISTGALECARIINPAENLDYIVADEKGLAVIEDDSLDVVYSFAMVQHITDEVFELVLGNCRRILKQGGRLILHIQLSDPDWRSETDWKADKSLRGRLKYRYGLHCFARSEAEHSDLVVKHGFKEIEINPISGFISEDFDDIWSQSLLTAIKG